MKKWFGVVSWCTFFLLTIVVNSSAEVSSDELLQILREKGIITDEDIDKARESRKEKEQIALSMLERGMDIALISEMTGLKLEEIEALKSA